MACGASAPPPPLGGSMSESKCNHRDENHQLRRDIVWEEFDARGISIGMVCDNCVGQKKSQYRTDIFTDPNYWADEQI